MFKPLLCIYWTWGYFETKFFNWKIKLFLMILLNFLNGRTKYMKYTFSESNTSNESIKLHQFIKKSETKLEYLLKINGSIIFYSCYFKKSKEYENWVFQANLITHEIDVAQKGAKWKNKKLFVDQSKRTILENPLKNQKFLQILRMIYLRVQLLL